MAVILVGAVLLGWLIAMAPKKRPVAAGRAPRAAKSRAAPPRSLEEPEPAEPADVGGERAADAAATMEALGGASADAEGVKEEAASPARRKQALKGARDMDGDEQDAEQLASAAGWQRP